eukprot:m.72235 g.72235  ORF g.72235 m.72235 type:complete len:107 (+) comp12312_c1_seq1:58-378(+)
MDIHKARVNGSMLASNINAHVTLVGEIIQDAGGILQVRACDGAQISVDVKGELPAGTPKFIEIIGEVQGQDNIVGQSFTALGDDFDLETYNEAVGILQKFPTPFTA